MISAPLPASTGEKEGQEERGGERTSGDVEDTQEACSWLGRAAGVGLWGQGKGKKLDEVGRGLDGMEHFVIALS